MKAKNKRTYYNKNNKNISKIKQNNDISIFIYQIYLYPYK